MWKGSFEKYKDEIESQGLGARSGIIVPGSLIFLVEWSDSIEHEERARQLVEEQERDEFEALEEAAADLIRLDRYERRSWSQQKRAIGNFMNLRMTLDVQAVAAPDQPNHEQWGQAEHTHSG